MLATVAVEELNYSAAAVGLFPDSAFALVRHFHQRCTERSFELLTAANMNQYNIRQRLFFALQFQLQQQLSHISTLPQMIGITLQPTHLPHSIQLLALYADDVWYRLGDTSTDLHWYSKRIYVAGVYASTQLYMSTDRSVEYRDTWQFLHRRLDEIQQLQSLPDDLSDTIKTWSGLAYTALQGMRK